MESAPTVSFISEGTLVSIVGEFKGYKLLEEPNGIQGWSNDLSFD